MEKIYPSVGDVISPVVPKATLSASIDLSYDDLKEISKALSKVNKALDKQTKRLGSDSDVSYKEIVGEVVDALALPNGKVAGLATTPPLITFYALNGRKVRSKLETWIPKLFEIESWRTLHHLDAKTAPIYRCCFLFS